MDAYVCVTYSPKSAHFLITKTKPPRRCRVEQVTQLSCYHVIDVDERVIDSHNFDPLLHTGPKDQTPNTAKSVEERKTITSSTHLKAKKLCSPINLFQIIKMHQIFVTDQ